MDERGLGDLGTLIRGPEPDDDSGELKVVEQGVEQQAIKIKDPWHSRPIDIHRASDHPGIDRIVDIVWTAHFQEYHDVSGRPGPRPKQSYRGQLKLVLLDLYVAWLEDPDLCIGVAMSATYWDTTSRYNALRISKRIIPIIYRLVEVGLVDLAKGSYSGPYGLSNRTSRIRATEALRVVFQGTDAVRDDIKRVDDEECIALRAGGPGENPKLVGYDDTDETNRMRGDLRAYNRVLLDSFIDIPGLEEAVIERTIEGGPKSGKAVRVPLDHNHHFVRRVFSRERWDLNGRFYGPWWQQIGSDLRRQIFINDTPTVEVDFKGLHVAILNAEQGIETVGDVYELPLGVVPGAPATLQRDIVKRLVLIALNATSKTSAFKSFRDDFPGNTMQKTLSDKELQVVLDAFVRANPHLEGSLCSDQGIRLMNVDSRIAERVHKHFADQGVAVLSIHDSFIVSYDRVRELKAVMADASEAVTGMRLPMAANGPGLDEYQDGETPEHVVQDFMWWRETARSQGYLKRLAAWEAKGGRVISRTRVT
jgi:hypothetical protein